MRRKIAVVVFNLGGPDSKNAIRPFLLNFFMDKNIIRLPVPFRCLLANMIANKRSKREAGQSYGELGDKSPLLENTDKQCKALEKALKADSRETQFKVFTCMRYWHPMAPQVVREVRDWGAEKIVILPLYPQFSTTTTWSSLEQWNKAMFEAGMELPTSTICCYHENAGYVEASAALIREQYDKAVKDGYQAPRVLFSAHGLPEKIVKDGDPYQWQCERSAEAIIQKLSEILHPHPNPPPQEGGQRGLASDEALLAVGGGDIDWQICYQSRVGPQKWIGPSLDEALVRAAQDKKAVVIYPHAFTQEHVETLVELDVEYKHEAEKLEVCGYYRAFTVGTHKAFIAGLAELVFDHLDKTGVAPEGGECPCPVEFGRCCVRMQTAGKLSCSKRAA